MTTIIIVGSLVQVKNDAGPHHKVEVDITELDNEPPTVVIEPGHTQSFAIGVRTKLEIRETCTVPK